MHLFPNNRQLQAEALEPMRKMMRWVIVNTVKHDGMIGYTFNSSHGSREKTWQDGQFSIVDFNGALPPHPMHTVLEQGLYWSALLRGADRLEAYYPKLAQKARYSAERIKTLFNRQFVYATDEGFRIARAIDGYGNKIESANIDSLIVLGFDYHDEMILSEANSQRMVEMIEFQMNELETEFGLRTQGISSFLVEGFGYHNKRSLWPFANGVAARALERRSNRYPHFHTTAIRIAEGIEKLLVYFDNPVETAQINEEGNLSLYEELRATTGEVFRSSLVQAWTVGWGTWIDAFLREERARKELI